MSIRSLYDIVKVDSDKVFLIDLNLPGTKSVTNDADLVWDDIQKLYPGKRIIYRDTMGRWDEMINEKSRPIRFGLKHHIGFKPYCETIPEIK